MKRRNLQLSGTLVGYVPLWQALAGALISLSHGCATYERAAIDVEDAVKAWQRQRIELPSASGRMRAPADGTAPKREPGADSPALTAAPVSIGNERLQAHIREALQRNPSIKAAIANVEAELAKIPQVTALPDPMLRAIVRPEPIQTAAGDVVFTLGVGQSIPVPARLERAGRAAAAEVRMAIEELNAARLRVIADVERAYFRLYLMDRYVELTAANRALLEDLEQVVTAQYEVGRAPQQDVLRLQTATAKLRDDENEYRLRRAAAAAALNQLADYPVAHPQPTTDTLDLQAVSVDVAELIRIAEEHNPDLARLTRQVERDQQRLELAKLAYWPDVTLGFEWSHLEGRAAFRPPPNPQTGMTPPFNRASEKGDDNWAITLQMNLPVWSQRIEAAKREARQHLRKTRQQMRSERNLIAFRIYDAWTRVEAQQQTTDLLKSTLIPQARQTYEVTLTAYQGGESNFLDVIDSWRRWLDFQLMTHRETVDLETAFSELQREVGLQLLRRTGPSSLSDLPTPTEPANEE